MAAGRPYVMPRTEPCPARPRTESFADLGVPAVLVGALDAAGITEPFPIQAATLPDSLAGRDVLGSGRTGSGKTYAFVLPVLARLAANKAVRRPGRPRALILAPTRELTAQIERSLVTLAAAAELPVRSTTIFGGVAPGRQVAALRAGVDVVVACPGRLADHLANGQLTLDDVEIAVIDEADHMADLGFLPVVRRIMDRTPRSGQRLLFSATLDAAVDVFVRQFMTNTVTHHADPIGAVPATSHHILHVHKAERVAVLVELAAAPGRTLVFTRTKHGAKRLTRTLVAAGVPSLELHGNLDQNARTRNLLAFANGTVTTLVATDIAARGIHVDDVALVIHADPPVERKGYVHRSGRTARAGEAGTVVTLTTDDQVADVASLTRQASITAPTTRLGPGHPLLAQIAPGKRAYVQPVTTPAASSGLQRQDGAPASAKDARPTARRAGAHRPAAGRGGTDRAARQARLTGAAAFSTAARSNRPRSAR
jgi:superfamily II DNA/RNA helicase